MKKTKQIIKSNMEHVPDKLLSPEKDKEWKVKKWKAENGEKLKR